jgi:hypothetical protein
MPRTRLLSFVYRPTPAKASLDVQRRTLRIANNLQVLALLAPAAVEYVESLTDDLRDRAELSARGPLRQRTS